jgi:hypothetical protein
VAQTGGGRASGAQGSSGQHGSARRQQKAGFSLFIDQLLDEAGNPRWESRLYHNESGVETTFADAAPDEWIAWILERLGTADSTGALIERANRQTTVEIASVEMLDVSIEADESEAESIHTIKARLVVQLSGIARLEREIGSRVLGEIASSDRSGLGHRD